MERKIGETFEYEGEKLKVIKAGTACDGCYFKGKSCDNRNYDITGICGWTRKDNQPVRFIKVTEEQQDEQPHEAEPQPKLNLCEILKDCPRGTKLYSTVLGYVIFQGILAGAVYPIIVTCENGVTEDFTADGKMFIDYDGECTLFPSKEQRSWTDFIAPWYKKERFDPKTFKAFDKVLARLNKQGIWCCELFSFIEDDTNLIKCCGAYYQYCIPYNDDTKHLINTTEDAPEFYRYWQD